MNEILQINLTNSFRDTAFIGCWMDYYVFNSGLSEPGMPCPPRFDKLVYLNQGGRLCPP